MSGKVPYVDDKAFQSEVLEAEQPVLVDFTATWCGPCKALAPVIDQLADKAEGKYKVVKVDIDQAPTLAQRYGIRGVPTVLAFAAGEKVGQHVGVTNAATLLKMLPA